MTRDSPGVGRHRGGLGRVARAMALTAAVLLASAGPGLATASDLARGERLYATWCLACHGPAREPVNGTSLNARHSVPVLVEGIANARSGMLFLRDALSAQDLSDIVAFLGTTPIAVDFGTVPADAASPTRRVVLQAGTNGISGLSVTVQGDFVRVGGDCARRLQADQACSVDLAFRPQGAGERQGVMLVSHDGLTSTAQVPLTAVAGPPAGGVPTSVLALDVDRVDFGTQTIGQPSAVRTVVATNRGDAPMTWLSRIPPPEFDVTDDCGATLAPAAQCRIAVRFTPRSTGPVGGDLVLVTSQAGGTVRLPLAGIGVAAAPRLRWTPSATRVDFPSTAIGRSGTATAPTLTNDGPGTVRIEAIRITGAQSGEFVVGDGAGCRAGLELAPAAGCSLPLVFSPRGLGDRSAALSIEASGEAPASLPLAGSGLPAPAPAPASNQGGGGCTLGGRATPTDPLWLLMTAGAVAVLVVRRRPSRPAAMGPAADTAPRPRP